MQTTPRPGPELTTQRHYSLEDVPRPPAPHSLEQIRGPGAPSRRPLNADCVVIGRAADADISIESTGVSRRHFQIIRNGPEYVCEDCDSSNGVYLNGIRVNSAVLREGDVIQAGDVVFIYHDHAT